MKRIVLIYGLIAGTIVGGMFAVTAPLWQNGTITFDNGMWVGYATMVIALSLIFFGIKSYRDNHSGGAISFGTAFKVGILIALIASLLYCIAWEICYNTLYPNFMEMAAQYKQATMKNSGATAQEIAKTMAEFQESAESYKNPLVRFAFTLMEIFPVGVVISLISAALLRKKEFLPAD
ncbi:DUF4199 domain-containing protein [Spirosoma endbachense]|uniref:DUF4199 family protein n=1 Tax=Spirosoma endbachense TaxID=2666025 RepID=A0A6P1VS26_9BACT|nr:DUF4199 domain-containing protein [Spirosoma endbachense]QHV94527.1 DUF4199 family protein [Spirosoma endbachense]